MTLRRRVAPALLALLATAAAPASAQAPAAPAPLDRLKSNIERITRGVNARWGVYVSGSSCHVRV